MSHSSSRESLESGSGRAVVGHDREPNLRVPDLSHSCCGIAWNDREHHDTSIALLTCMFASCVESQGIFWNPGIAHAMGAAPLRRQPHPNPTGVRSRRVLCTWLSRTMSAPTNRHRLDRGGHHQGDAASDRHSPSPSPAAPPRSSKPIARISGHTICRLSGGVRLRLWADSSLRCSRGNGHFGDSARFWGSRAVRSWRSGAYPRRW